MRITSSKLLENIEFLLIFIFIQYSMWFQYGFFIINSLLSLVGLCMLLVIFLRNRIVKTALYNDIMFLLIFLVVTFFVSILVSNNRAAVVRIILQIVKYLIPMTAIIDYVKYDGQKYRRTMTAFALAGFMLSALSLLNGAMTSNGGSTLGDLNTNVLASYLNLAVFAILILFENAKLWGRVLLGLDYIFCALALIGSASRKGALVLILLSIIYLYIFCHFTEKKENLQKFLLIAIAFVAALYVLSHIASLIDSSTLVKRLFGGGDVFQSDLLRKKYHTAAFLIFKDSPIFGRGFSAVASSVGMHSHSLYLELLACTGVVGTALFVWFLVRSAIVVFRLIKKNKAKLNRVTAYTTLAFIASIIVSGIQVTYIYDSFFYLMVAAYVSSINILKGEVDSSENSLLFSKL